MTYTLYRDKSRLFECDIKVNGAKISDTSARLILKFDDGTISMYEGKIGVLGNCSIEIPSLSEAKYESDKGEAILEVIADSTVFESWKSPFELEKSKGVTVEVIDTDKQPITERKVRVKTRVNEDTQIVSNLKNQLSEMSKTDLKALLVEYKETGLSKKTKVWMNKTMPHDKTKQAQLIGKMYELIGD